MLITKNDLDMFMDAVLLRYPILVLNSEVISLGCLTNFSSWWETITRLVPSYINVIHLIMFNFIWSRLKHIGYKIVNYTIVRLLKLTNQSRLGFKLNNLLIGSYLL